MLGELLRMGLWSVISDQLCQQVAALKLEVKSRVSQLSYFWNLFRRRPISIAEAGQVSAMDPFA